MGLEEGEEDGVAEGRERLILRLQNLTDDVRSFEEENIGGDDENIIFLQRQDEVLVIFCFCDE